MALLEGEIVNEKNLSISEKSNSLLIKSLNEGDFNLMDFLKEKFHLLITIYRNKNTLTISNRSTFKIFQLLSNENIESMLSDYITFNVLEDNFSYKDEVMLNNQENILGILDAPFVKLLDKTKSYKININKAPASPIEEIKKDLSNFEAQKNKIDIKSKSINKICKFLCKSIYDMSDYINIVILFLSIDDINKETIQNTIIKKYSNLRQFEDFMGKKNYNLNLEKPLKNEKNVIFKLDDLFENVLNKIDNIENNSSEENSDENKDKNKDKNNNNDNGENLETPKKFIEQKIKIKQIQYNEDDDIDNNEDEIDKRRKCNCQKDVCSFCNIF